MVRKLLSSAYVWMRRNPLIIYLGVTVIYIAIAKWGYDENPIWLNILYLVLSAPAFNWITNQLPHKRYKSLLILFVFLFVVFVCAAFRILPSDNETTWILAILLALTLGYGGYCAWRWRKQVGYVKEVLLGRELKRKRRRMV